MNNFNAIYKRLICLLTGMMFLLRTEAQMYNVGDTVKSIHADHLVNGGSEIFTYEKGKALILDFWATWCSPCIALFPKIDSLKKKIYRAIGYYRCNQR
ncbi:thioredoxin domain-containing protein [Niabella defluvii]|nr:thioredoxin domain-containing protein [Niabella sp. I65]